MNIRLWKRALLVSTGLCCALGLPAIAVAQTQVGDVVVTARRIEERLQDVPASISVLNQAELRDRNIINASDLAAYTPSLTATVQFGSDLASSFVLRGFSSDNGTSPTVGVYFAEAVAPRGGFGGTTIHAGDGAGPGSFFDLQNVQVLKGPQGTLFGRNTTGGAIIIQPKKPTSEYEGYVEAGAGNYDMEHLQAVLNAPLSSKFRVRFGIDQQKRDGFVKNISGIGPRGFENVDYIAARFSAVADITDQIENYTVVTYAKSDTHGSEASLVDCDPSSFLGQAMCAQLAAQKPLSGKYTVSSPLNPVGNRLRQWQIVNTTTWRANENLTVKNIAAYAELKADVQTGLFGDDMNFGPGAPHVEVTTEGTPPGMHLTSQRTFSDELQFQGRNMMEGKLDWQLGLYMESSQPIGLSGSQHQSFISCANYQTFQCVGSPFGPGVITRRIGTITWRNYGIYGQATYAFSDRFKVTAGLRYTRDTTEGSTLREGFLVGGGLPTPIPLPASSTNAFGCEGGVTTPGCVVGGRQKSSAPTGTINLQYTPNRDVLAYFQFSRGYRQGGFLPTGPIGSTTFKPEKVNTYELGLKTSFHGSIPVILNVAAFYNDFHKMQLLGTFVAVPNVNNIQPNSGIVNAGSSRIYGLEADSTISLTDDLKIGLGYAYLNSKLTKVNATIQNPVYNVFGAGVPPGGRLSLTPNHRFTATVTYHLPVDESLGEISAGATYVYTSSQFVYEPAFPTGPGGKLVYLTSPYANLKSTSLLNLNVNWESIGGRPVDAEFFMTNVMNLHYSVYNDNLGALFGPYSKVWGPPRMFGGRLRYHF